MKKLFKIYRFALIGLMFFVPLAVLAATGIEGIFEQGGILDKTLRTVVGILFVIATIVFLWGVIQFIAKSGDEAGRAKAKGIMTWGIVGLAVTAAAWGVASLLAGYFTVPGNRGIPRLPGQAQ